LARIRAALRSAFPVVEGPVFRNGPLEMDLDGHEVKVRGEIVKLTKIEYALLRILVKHVGKVLTQRQIMREVWGPSNETQTHYLRIYISHLRDKSEADPSQPQLIITNLESAFGFSRF
ncbi:MAG: winged helix-turn-helix domain-containing protein, partial [Limisphaerales bacterium]